MLLVSNSLAWFIFVRKINQPIAYHRCSGLSVMENNGKVLKILQILHRSANVEASSAVYLPGSTPSTIG
jgi:hypothetical protein